MKVGNIRRGDIIVVDKRRLEVTTTVYGINKDAEQVYLIYGRWNGVGKEEWAMEVAPGTEIEMSMDGLKGLLP